MASSRKSTSDLSGRVADALVSVVPQGSSLLVGLSGGLDSVVLLHLLSRLSPQFSWRLSALHVHHGISRHADDWADFCADLCAQLKVPFRVERVDIGPLRHLGIEAAARQLRHAALAGQAVDFIALAHHRDDQAETLLLQLLRGAGVQGAAAMPRLRQRRAAPALLRPLLECERSELEDYAREQGLNWVEDDSNADIGYPRNFLRHRILPQLEQRFPAYRATLARSAGHFAEAAGLLDELAQQDAALAMDDGRLRIDALRPLSDARGKNLLRYYLQQCAAPLPDSTRLAEMLRQLRQAGSDTHLCVSWGGWEVRSFRGQVHVMPVLPPPCDFSLRWQGEAELLLPGPHGRLLFRRVAGQGLSLARLQAGVTVQPRHGQASLRPSTGRPRRSLRNLLHEHGMPPWLRERLPLLYCEGELVCVPGVAIEVSLQAGADEPGVQVEWQPA